MKSFVAKLDRASLAVRFKKVGKNLMLVPFGSVFSAETIELGHNVFIGQQAYFGGIITIGNNVMFGPRVTIVGADHLFAVEGESVRFLKPHSLENARPVSIEDEAWIGANAILIGEITVGMGAVVGAGSVVTSDVPPFTIVGGNPARTLRRIFNDGVLLRHLRSLGYSEEFAKNVIARRRSLLGGVKLHIVDRTHRRQDRKRVTE